MSIPRYVPIIASDNGNFPAGGDSWANTAKRVELSAGGQVAGFVPDEPLDGQTANWLLGTLGEHLNAIVDSHVFTWRDWPAYINADLSADTTGNRNESDDPALIYPAGERWIVKTVGGGTGVCFHSRAYGLGNKHSADSDTTLFIPSADSGAGATACLITRRDSNRIVAISGGGTARYTDDYGGAWNAGGTTPGAEASGLYWNGAYYRISSGSTDLHSIYKTTTLSGAWSNETGGGLVANAEQYYRNIMGAPAAVFLPSVCSTDSQLAVNTGSGWQAVTVTGAGASSGWRGDYNPQTGQYLITNLAGQCYVSTNATTWTLLYTHSTAIYDVAASGRGFVLSCVTEDFSGPATFPHLVFLAYSPAQAVTAYRIPWEAVGQIYPRYFLIRHRGRVIAARLNVGAGSPTDRLEFWTSNVCPADVSASTGL